VQLLKQQTVILSEQTRSQLLFFHFDAPYADILSSILSHNFSELLQRIRCFLLIINSNSRVVTEVYPADCQKLLDIVLTDERNKISLYSFVSTASHKSST